MENLRQLMAAYFHQDWYDEYGGSWQAAVDDFVRRAPSRVEGTRADIATLLGTTANDAELAEALDALGSFYWAGDDPDSYTAWLSNIDARLGRGTPNEPAAPVAPNGLRKA